MSHAVALPRADGTPAVTTSMRLADGIDPLALLSAVRSPQRFFWQRDDVAVAGVGAAWTARASGPDRFARIADALAALPDDAIAVGGFAFDDAPSRRGAWREFPPTVWTVPRLAVVRRDGETRLVAVGASDADVHRVADLLARPTRPATGATRYQALVQRDAATWRRMVDRTLADVAGGRLAKLVLARTAVVRADRAFDPVRVVDRLRAAYPTCATFLVRHGDATFVGATPERLVRVDGDRLSTSALAGTTGRGAGPAADRALADALHASTKERGEHALVVDDVRARLAPLCRDVHVAGTPDVVGTETVQHLHTPVTARLRAGHGLLDAVAALHPTAAICGAPRLAAARLLRAREGIERGWYGGGVGWTTRDAGEVSVAIRSALLHGRRATLYAGAGIVAGSRWESELEETRLKLRPMLGALLEL